LCGKFHDQLHALFGAFVQALHNYFTIVVSAIPKLQILPSTSRIGYDLRMEQVFVAMAGRLSREITFGASRFFLSRSVQVSVSFWSGNASDFILV
jgi:hypothetical protein